MDTQNTPIHPRLWNRDFWLLAAANMLVTMAAYMQVMLCPALMAQEGWTEAIPMAMAAQAIGVFLLGPCCSFLVQKYRRNHVCELAILAMAALATMPTLLAREASLDAWMVVAARGTAAACYGLAQMTLTSTLIVDCTESFQRTEANYAAAWFGRLAVSLGPLLACLLTALCGIDTSVWTSAAIALAAIALIRMVNFPFRAPDDSVRKVSLDRFLLPSAWLLFANLALVSAALGMVMATMHQLSFYAMLMVGFLIALVAEKVVFVNAELKSESVAGLTLMAAALTAMLTRNHPTITYVAPVLIGMGIGLVGSRFLLFFIKMSRHCQRGTSQSSFFLAWETGLGWGLAAGYALANSYSARYGALVCVAVALVAYVVVTHSWYIKHKNR